MVRQDVQVVPLMERVNRDEQATDPNQSAVAQDRRGSPVP